MLQLTLANKSSGLIGQKRKLENGLEAKEPSLEAINLLLLQPLIDTREQKSSDSVDELA